MAWWVQGERPGKEGDVGSQTNSSDLASYDSYCLGGSRNQHRFLGCKLNLLPLFKACVFMLWLCCVVWLSPADSVLHHLVVIAITKVSLMSVASSRMSKLLA